MNYKTKIVIALNKSYWYRKLAYYYQKWSVGRNPMNEIMRNYEPRFHKLPNLDNPRNLVEKIYWMQLHCDTSSWTLCADKYRMREHVEKCGCSSYLPQLYGVWDDARSIDWDSLPNEFVIKANNGCATVLVVENKLEYNGDEVKKTMSRWLDIPYGYRGYQPHYLSIKPCILAEELLKQDPWLNELSSSIVDFKIWSFNGKPECIFITYDRSKHFHYVDLYDTNWVRMKDKLNFNGDFGFKEEEFPKPECLDLMLDLAAKLSKGFPQMRVDFYIVGGKPVIGELTMAAGYGNLTEEFYNHLGDLTDLSLMKKIK